MDKLTTYRQHIQTLLLERVNLGSTNPNVETQAIFDTERDHYQVVRTGWKDSSTRVHGCLIHIDIKDNKIWIQHDGTEEGIANQLADLGVAKQEIVLAYHAPHVRQYTEFAIG